MVFLAQGPASTATFLYDVQSKTRKGITLGATVTQLEKVGVKNYGATLSSAFLALFSDVAPNFD